MGPFPLVKCTPAKGRAERRPLSARDPPARATRERGVTKRSRRPPCGCSLRHVLDGKVNHHQAGCGQPFIEPLARLDIARGDQQFGRGRADPDCARSQVACAPTASVCLTSPQDGLAAGIVETLLEADLQAGARAPPPGAPRSHACARPVETSAMSGVKAMPSHIGADGSGVLLTARIEAALTIAHAGFGLFRLGVSKQYKAHGSSIDFSRAAV